MNIYNKTFTRKKEYPTYPAFAYEKYIRTQAFIFFDLA
jgi:hypothetical protein